MLGKKRRGTRLCAWLTWLPAIGFLPHISQILAIAYSIRFIKLEY
jgi:hypothetical protein